MDETCSHIAAILFKTQAAVIMGLNKPSCTSKACEWNQAFKKCVTPAKAADIKTGLSSASTKRKRTAVLTAAPVTPQVKSQMQSELLRFSKQHKSVYMTSVDENNGHASGRCRHRPIDFSTYSDTSVDVSSAYINASLFQQRDGAVHL